MLRRLTKAILLLLPFLSSGCVLKMEHDEMVARALKCEAELQNLSKGQEQSKTKAQDCQGKLAELESRNEELSQTNQMLASKNGEYSKRSIDAQKEILKLKEEKDRSAPKPTFPSQVYENISKALEVETRTGVAFLIQKEEELIIQLSDRFLFSPGTSHFQTSALPILRRISEILKQSSIQHISVEGHTDNQPIPPKLRKTSGTHWELSSMYASKVVTYFEESGVDASRLEARGYGWHRPISPNTTEEGRRKNRRVEIVLSVSKSVAN